VILCITGYIFIHYKLPAPEKLWIKCLALRRFCSKKNSRYSNGSCVHRCSRFES